MFLNGKTAIVTGSTSGIGLAYARAFAKEGAAVVINGFGEAAAIEAIRAELAAISGAGVLHDAADMTRPDEIAALVDRTAAAFGSVDIVVNNAGIQHVARIEEFPPDRFEAIIDINLKSAWYMMRAAVPHMRARGWGRIITTASAHSLVASPNKSAYVMAKHGVVGLTKTIALETATAGITVNCISPGYVWTPLVEAQIPDQMRAHGMDRETVIREVMLERQPSRQFATPEQVGGTAAWLCSPSADQVTGTTISIDGGWTAL